MGSNAQDTNILQGGQVRIFIQKDGVSPANPYYYYGCLSLNGPSQDLGTPDPIYCPSTEKRNKWDIVDSVPKVQALGTTDFTQHADKRMNDVWWELRHKGCKFNMQAVISSCDRPDDFSRWTSKLLFRGVRLTNLALGALNPLSGGDNAPVDITGTLTFDDWLPLQGLSFGEEAGATVLAEVLDGVFNDNPSCGECGSISDGCQKTYWLTVANPGSPGNSSQIVYTINGGATWHTLDINVLGGLSGNRIAVVGTYLVVVSQAYGGHAFEDFTSINSGIVGWTGVKTGYVAGKSPRCIFSKSTQETFIGAQGGYIYLMVEPGAGVTVLTDGTVSAQDLNDIHGTGQTVVAVGASNAVLKSNNSGGTWSLVVGPTPGVNLAAIWCLTETTWFVGTGNGKLYYTTDSGVTWTQIALASGISVINDIQFADEVVGYLSCEIGGAARVYRTTDSGAHWSYQGDMTGIPTALRMNVVVPCTANVLGVGGIVTAGGDGIIAFAE